MRPIISTIAVLLAIGAVANILDSDEPGIVDVAAYSQGLAGDFEAQERLRRKHRLFCLKIIEKPTHIWNKQYFSDVDSRQWFNVSVNTVTQLRPSCSSEETGLCIQSVKLYKDIVSDSNGNDHTNRWEIKGGKLVNYRRSRCWESGWKNGDVRKTEYTKITKNQVDKCLNKYGKSIAQEREKLK